MPIESRIPAWVHEYQGIPFAPRGRDRGGIDCFGLLRLVYEEQLRILLPSFTESYTTALEKEEVRAAFASELPKYGRPIAAGEERCFDAIFVRPFGRLHCGVVVARGWMLTVTARFDEAGNPIPGSGSSGCERYDSVMWRNRIEGFFRWRES
jgi:cell wall-associated NlpC family hydrolase